MEQASSPVLFGRADLLDEVLRSRAPITLITGDSGIGKSALVEACAQSTEVTLSNRPVTIRYTQPALHALLVALAELAAAIAETTAPEKVIQAWITTGRNLADSHLQDLPRVVTAVALGFFKARLGYPGNRLLDEYLEEAKRTTPAGIATAIVGELEPLSTEVAVDLIGALADVRPDDRPIRLCLDAAENLAQEQLRLFPDLASALPDGAQILIAHRTSNEIEVQRAVWLVNSSTAIQQIEISALSEGPIAEWLGTRQLDEALADKVVQKTGGYPLHVSDTITHLENGGVIATVPLHEDFVRATNATWHTLSDNDRRAAGKLAVLATPLALAELQSFIQIGEGDWYSLIENLERTRIFSVHVNGLPWFHEERRAGVLSALSIDELEAHHRDAAEFFWSMIDSQGRSEMCPELSFHLEHSRTLRATSGQIDALFGLSELHLSLLAAALEIVEPSNQHVAQAYPLLRHWAHRWRREGDPVKALRDLYDRGILVVAEKESAAIVALFSDSPMSLAAQAGQVIRILGQTPIRAMSSSLFEWILRPRLGVFGEGSVGQGRPTPAYLCETIARATRDEDDLSGLLATARLGTTPLFLTATYSDDAERDEALAALQGLQVRILDEEFVVDDAAAYPIGRQPSERPIQAYETALRRHIHKLGRVEQKLSRAMRVEQWMKHRVETVKTLRELVGESERYAMDLHRTWGIVWGAHGGRHHEVSIAGGQETATSAKTMDAGGELPWAVWGDPYATFRLSEILELPPSAEVRSIHTSMAPATNVDPVLHQLGELRDVARNFNKMQPSALVILDRAELESLLQDAVNERMRIARALADRLPIGGERVMPPAPTLTCVALALEEPAPSWVPGARSTMYFGVFRGLVEKDEVQLSFIPGEAHDSARHEFYDLPTGFDLGKEFGVDWHDEVPTTHGVFTHVVADLLGYQVDDLSFDWP